MKQEFSPYFVNYMDLSLGFVTWICDLDLSLGFVTWICLNLNWLLAVTGVMHEADDAYSIRSTWSCNWLDQFLTLALNILILSIFYISMDLSTNYFAHFSGCWASFACSCHYPRMLCHVFWSQVKYKIVCFISTFLLKKIWEWPKLLNFVPFIKKTRVNLIYNRIGALWLTFSNLTVEEDKLQN